MASNAQPDVRARMDNGFEVLLKGLHAEPTASCSLWYRVGSRDQRPGLTGISHGVEPKQFEGTPAYLAGVPDRLIDGMDRHQILDTAQRYNKLDSIATAVAGPIPALEA